MKTPPKVSFKTGENKVWQDLSPLHGGLNHILSGKGHFSLHSQQGGWFKKHINFLLFPPVSSCPLRIYPFHSQAKKQTEQEQISKDQWMNFQESSGLTNHTNNKGNCRDNSKSDGKNTNMPPPSSFCMQQNSLSAESLVSDS